MSDYHLDQHDSPPVMPWKRRMALLKWAHAAFGKVAGDAMVRRIMGTLSQEHAVRREQLLGGGMVGGWAELARQLCVPIPPLIPRCPNCRGEQPPLGQVCPCWARNEVSKRVKPRYRRVLRGEVIPAGCEIGDRGRHRNWRSVNPAAVGRIADQWLHYRVRIN